MKKYKYLVVLYAGFMIMKLSSVTYFDMIEDTIASNVPVATSTKVVINGCPLNVTDINGVKKSSTVAITLYVDPNNIVKEIVIPYKNSSLDEGNFGIICGNVQKSITPILNNTGNKNYCPKEKPYSARYIMTWKSKKYKSAAECNNIDSDTILFFSDNDEMLFAIKFDGINKYLGLNKSEITLNGFPISIVEMGKRSKNKTDISPFINAPDADGRFKYHYAVYGSNSLYKKVLIKYGAIQGPFADSGVYYNVVTFPNNNILSGNNSSVCDQLIIFNDQTVWANYQNLPSKVSDFNLQSFLNNLLPKKSLKPCPSEVPYFMLDQSSMINKNIFTFIIGYETETKIQVYDFNKMDGLVAYSKDYQVSGSTAYYTIVDAVTKQVKEVRKYTDIKKNTTTFIPPKLTGIGSVLKNSDNAYIGIVTSLDGMIMTDIIYADADANFINIWSIDNSDNMTANLISGYDNGVSVNVRVEGNQMVATLTTASGVNTKVGMMVNSSESSSSSQGAMMENESTLTAAVTKGVVPESALTFQAFQERVSNYAFKNAYITPTGERYILF